MSTSNLSRDRRSDLDALRAFAMLLGIVLHASLAFFPALWMVADRQQSTVCEVLFSAIHGFRMPAFFLMSGYFSAMLLSRRGRKSMVSHRFRRVFLPLLLGMATVIPATNWISGVAIKSAASQNAEPERKPDADDVVTIWSAAGAGDLTAIERTLADGAAVNGLSGEFQAAPLHYAALWDRAEAIEWLIRRGADPNIAATDGGTPLHAAAFVGAEKAVAKLLEHGANINPLNQRGQTPLDNATVDEATTLYFASLFRLPVTENDLGRRKAAIAELLRQKGATRQGPQGLATLLMQIPLFSHLWFLWILWWLVLGLALVSAVVERLPKVRPPAWMVVSPARYLWLVPLTMLPQSLMELGGFGPDTSSGLLPIPRVLAYYAIFFGFGALYHSFDDRSASAPTPVRERWRLPLAIGLLVVFPLGMILTAERSAALGIALDPSLRRTLLIGLQAAYPWLMTFGLMGLFRRCCPVESPTMRYLSDSAYWLYLAHLPLIVAAQWAIRDWPIPALLKLVLIVAVVTSFLLWTYQTLVRYTWLGRFLNGPRVRPGATEAPATVS